MRQPLRPAGSRAPRVHPSSDESLLESAVMPHPAELPEESIAGRASPANDPTVIHAELPSTLDFEDDTGPARTPLRFGRLALWMASASALGIGVLGTVGYSMWFTHDQRVYSEAMASARKTLGVEQPALALTQSAGSVEAAGAHGTSLANPTPLPGDTPTSAMTTTPYTVALADNTPSTDSSDAPAIGAGHGSAAGAGLAATAVAAAQNANSAATQGTPSAADEPSSARAGQPAAQRKVAHRSARSSQQMASQSARRRSAQAKSEQPGLFARMGAFFHRVSYQQRNVPTRQREEYSRP
jgi:hypothetical protein